jgi:cell division protein YceG involved in septum cleavage
MSIKRQIQHKYRNFVHAIETIAVPAWVTSRTTRVSLLAVILFFGIAYIVNTTSSATSGYQMHELEKQKLSLETEVQKLQVEIADRSSMSSISSRLAKLNMVEASNIKYLIVKNTPVAKN